MMPPERSPSRDHVIPRMQGGGFRKPGNGLVVCQTCNSMKRSRSLERFLCRYVWSGKMKCADHVVNVLAQRDNGDSGGRNVDGIRTKIQTTDIMSVFPTNGGRGGIRTHDTLAGMPVFKTGALNRSATLPTR
jgi:hypothetical protein